MTSKIRSILASIVIATSYAANGEIIYPAYNSISDIVKQQRGYNSGFDDEFDFVTLPEICPRTQFDNFLPGSSTNYWTNVQYGRYSKCWNVFSNGVQIATNFVPQIWHGHDLFFYWPKDDVGLSSIDCYLDYSNFWYGNDLYPKSYFEPLEDWKFDFAFTSTHYRKDTPFYFQACGPWEYREISDDGIGIFRYSERHDDDVRKLSAIYSIYNAYRERLYYASQGQSNVWDEAEWGGSTPEDFNWSVSNSVCDHTDMYLKLYTNEMFSVSPRLLEYDHLTNLVRAVKRLYPLEYDGENGTKNEAFVYRPGWILSDPGAKLWWATTCQLPEVYDAEEGYHLTGDQASFPEFTWLEDNLALTNDRHKWKYACQTLDLFGSHGGYEMGGLLPALELWKAIRRDGYYREFDVDLGVENEEDLLHKIVVHYPTDGLSATEWLARFIYPMSAWEMPAFVDQRGTESQLGCYNKNVWGDPDIRTDVHQYVGPAQYLALMDKTYEIPSSHIEVASNHVWRYRHRHPLQLKRNEERFSYAEVELTNGQFRLVFKTGFDYPADIHVGDLLASYEYGDENYDNEPSALCESYHEDLGLVAAEGLEREMLQVKHSGVQTRLPPFGISFKAERPIMASDLFSAALNGFVDYSGELSTNEDIRIVFTDVWSDLKYEVKIPCLFSYDVYSYNTDGPDDFLGRGYMATSLDDSEYRFFGNMNISNDVVYIERYYDVTSSVEPKFLHGPIQPGNFLRVAEAEAHWLMAGSYWVDYAYGWGGLAFLGHDFASKRKVYSSVEEFDMTADYELFNIIDHLAEELDNRERHNGEYFTLNGYANPVFFAQLNDLHIRSRRDILEYMSANHYEEFNSREEFFYDPEEGLYISSFPVFEIYCWNPPQGSSISSLVPEVLYKTYRNPKNGEILQSDYICSRDVLYGWEEDLEVGRMVITVDDVDLATSIDIDDRTYPKEFVSPPPGQANGTMKSIIQVLWGWDSLNRIDPD